MVIVGIMVTMRQDLIEYIIKLTLLHVPHWFGKL
jgi:hypothetical protein